MKHHNYKTAGLKRLAWMAVLIVVLRIAAWDLHHVLDQHDYQSNAYCDVCLVAERGGDAIAVDHGHGLLPAVHAQACSFLPGSLRAAMPPAPLPRGPPSFPA
jgi:hypothetical protein